jgi:D-alanine-D-alanine ligase
LLELYKKIKARVAGGQSKEAGLAEARSKSQLWPHLRFRQKVRRGDVETVRRLVASTGFFSTAEIEVAVELVEERLRRGLASGYYFLFAEAAGQPVGYACFGPIACTLGSFDFYWIAVTQELRGRNIGRELLSRSEEIIAQMGGSRIYVETSSRPQYQPTRSFYERQGYQVAAVLQDFYAPGDDKVVYLKIIKGLAA